MLNASIPFHQTLVIYQNAIQYEPEITLDVLHATNKVGGTLVGLDSVVKPLSSIEDKVNRKLSKDASDLNFLYNSFSDIIRYTCLFSKEDIPQKSLSLLNELLDQGYGVGKIDNRFKNPKKYTHYKGLHFDLISPDEIIFELQIHTKESYQTKIDMHPYYEITRDKNNIYTQNQKRIALTIQQLAFDRLPDIPDLCLEEGIA